MLSLQSSKIISALLAEEAYCKEIDLSRCFTCSTRGERRRKRGILHLKRKSIQIRAKTLMNITTWTAFNILRKVYEVRNATLRMYHFCSRAKTLINITTQTAFTILRQLCGVRNAMLRMFHPSPPA